VVGPAFANLPGQTPLGLSDAYLRKLDSSGNEVWTRQFGTDRNDIATGVIADSTGIYITGCVNGQLGATWQGGMDVFVRKYDLNGEELWTDQFGSPGMVAGECAYGIASDGTDLYISGYTNGVLENQTSYGGSDGFIRKYTIDGTVLWTQQFGSDTGDEFTGVAADASGVYATGHTFGTMPGQTKSLYSDTFVLKYSPAGGDPLWIQQIGTDFNDYGQSVAVNESSVYVGGYYMTNSPPYTNHAILQKFTLNGEFVWQNFFMDNPINHIYGVAVDATGIYLSGYQIALNHSFSIDAALVKLSLEGNAAPEVGAITVSATPVATNTVVNASASYTDANTGDTHTAEWDWGDGTTSAGMVNETAGAGTISGSHTYTAPGVYGLTLTVTDSALAAGSATYQYVVVYDPSAGFVTGGGWLDSPAGAYKADETLTGRATFGFVSKYLKGAAIPTGNTAFEFNLAGLEFASTSYEWLVVNQAATNAQFKGSGMINGALDNNGNPYRFLLWAGDGASANSADTFRIKIWWEGPDGIENVVYDNGAAQTIGGGNIVVHTKK
jgi:PKD repeat protein